MRPEFDLYGHSYAFAGMSAQVELRVLRRMAPLIAPIVPMFLRRGSKPGSYVEVRRDIDVPKAVSMIFEAFGRLSDDDLGYVERAALGALCRMQYGAWVPVWPADASAPAFSLDGVTAQCLLGRSLGLVVKGWIEKGGEAMPPEVQALARVLH